MKYKYFLFDIETRDLYGPMSFKEATSRQQKAARLYEILKVVVDIYGKEVK